MEDMFSRGTGTDPWILHRTQPKSGELRRCVATLFRQLPGRENFRAEAFDYATNGKTGLGRKYQPPQLGAEVTDTTILNDINAAAFGNTPAYFQKELCNLEYLFIDRNLSSKETAGWGFWEAPDQSSHGVSNSFVGISPSVWSTSSGGMLASLTQYKTNILASMLSTVGVSTAVAYSGANENGKVVLLRAILAHEVGHILYRSGKVVNACSAEYDLTWDKYGKPKKPKRMLPFALSRRQNLGRVAPEGYQANASEGRRLSPRHLRERRMGKFPGDIHTRRGLCGNVHDGGSDRLRFAKTNKTCRRLQRR